jgi:hypothetical protein
MNTLYPGPRTGGMQQAFSPDDPRGWAWFEKCHFQVTPEINRALMVGEFPILGVTLI